MSAVVWVLVLIGVLGLPAATVAVLGRTRVAVGLGVVWAAWIVVSVVLAANDFYRAAPGEIRPWVGVAVVAVFVAALAAARIPSVATILAEPGMAARLVRPQMFRVIGAVFLIAMLLGELPAIFALPAGLGDVAVGIAAYFVARRARQTAWFHVLGLLDLVVAVGIGFLAGPGGFIAVSPSTVEVTLLPLVLIPTTAVPLAAALHVAALTRLRTPVAVR